MVYIRKHCRTLVEVLILWNYCVGDPCRLFCVSKPLFLIFNFYTVFPPALWSLSEGGHLHGLQPIDAILYCLQLSEK